VNISRNYFPILLALLFCVQCTAQKEITRIEYTAGSRTFRHQIILTPDSVVSIEENFRGGDESKSRKARLTSKEWEAVILSLKGVSPKKISELKSPTDKRTYDAAAHGSIILTIKDGSSYTHGFDDADPHEVLRPLMKQILRYRLTGR
jgi:hypothetical protein